MTAIKRGLVPVHAGVIFKELIIDTLPRMSVSIAAKALDVSRAHLGEVTKGRSRITPELAAKIARATGTSSEMWLKMQVSYDLWITSQNPDVTKNVVKGSLST